MKNRKNLLLLMAMCLTLTMADASSLVQMDIKKTSDNAIDLTFFTTGSSGTPMVTRKSNNKYVILMPNVSGRNAGTPSLSAVKDIITNVDIKNVDDGMNGYTKVTLITTKPINISTHTQKTAPLTSEEKQAKAIIAQAKTKPLQSAASENNTVAKTKVTSSSSVTKTDNKKAEAQKIAAKKPETPKSETKIQQKKQQTPQKSVSAPTPVKSEEPIVKTEENIVPETVPTSQVATEEPVLNMKEVEKIERMAKTSSHRNYAGLLLLLLPLWLLSLLAKSVKNSVQKSNALKSSFNANLAEKPFVQESYDNIINDKELTWQERYKKFVEESKDEAKMSKYSFIKPVSTTKVTTPVAKASTKDINLTTTPIDKKRLELEHTLSKTPEVYKNTEINIEEQPVNQVQSEDNVIQQNMIQLKAFANPVSLHTTHRGRTKTTLPKLPKAKESKFVNLKQSDMNTTTRHFKGGTLSVSDLMKTGNKYIKEQSSQTENQDYVMSSVDEYFSILDKEKELMTAPKDLSSKIAGSLSNLKPSMNLAPRASARSTNPIKQHRTNSADGLVIKNGYNIDENRGFYIANVDGLNSLIGRINNETFVLKTFDSNVNNLQVRHDSENVYVVKAGDFKALVDVSEDKMGVLIEL